MPSSENDASASARTAKRRRTARTALGFSAIPAVPARPEAVEGPLTSAHKAVVNAVISELLRDVTGELPVSELRVSAESVLALAGICFL